MRAPRDPPTVVIRLQETFDLPAARLLENSLKRENASRVRVDFSRVRQFNDFAIAVLAQAIKGHRVGEVKVRGLRLHQVRLLRYFGVAPEVFRPEAEPAPE